MTSPQDKWIQVGVIAGVHGLKGDVKILSFMENPEDITAYGILHGRDGVPLFAPTLIGEHKGMLIARISGITDRNSAEALKGRELYLDRALLPPPDEDAFYQHDLIGLPVVTTDNQPFGMVKAVHNFGAGDIVEIDLPTGKSEMFIFSATTFPTVDIAAKRLVIFPPEVLEAEGNPND